MANVSREYSELAVSTGPWFDALLRKPNGRILCCLANIYEVLKHDSRWQGVLAFDYSANRVVKRLPPPWKNGQVGPWEPQDTTKLEIWITRCYRLVPSTKNLEQVIEVVAKDCS